MAAKKEIKDGYAVIETGGRQRMVKTSDIIRVNRIDAEVGKTVELAPVLALSDGKSLQIGKPTLDKAAVKSTVVKHVRGNKVRSFKKKRRKGYSRRVGHRQELTVLKIESIN
ncbi:MAG: 50S ribosomal protein L21 [Lentisphaerae bacterium]|nr:50S ribosomal protein L21 [Lentisphaerota bacterium]